MKAFIFAAGFGERLKPVTDTIPKPLIPINGVPAICYSIAQCKSACINDIVINLHYRGDDIIDFFKENSNFNMNIDFSYEEEILGTGGGLKRCESHFNEPFLVMNSDVITDIDLQDLINVYNNSPYNSMVVLKKKDANIEGTVSVHDDRVVDFKNSLKSDIEAEYEYTGFALLEPGIFKYLQKDFSSIVYTGYTSLIKTTGLGYYLHKDYWRDIGTIDSLNKINEDLKRNNIFDLLIKENL